MIPIWERERLLARLEELAVLPPEVERLAAVEEPTAVDHRSWDVDLDAVLTRMLARAERDGSLDDPARRRNVEATWRWIRGVKERENGPQLTPSQTAGVFHGIVLERNPWMSDTEFVRGERAIERLEWALIGIAQAIRGRMPRSLLRAGEGHFRIDLAEGDAIGCWEHEDAGAPFSLRRLARGCFASLGGFATTIADRLSSQYVLELPRGIPLVGFGQPEKSPEGATLWLRWLPPQVEPAPEGLFEEAIDRLREGYDRPVEGVPEDEGAVEAAEQAEVELWLRKADPELAARLDTALCAAALFEHTAHQKSRIEELERVIEEHQDRSEGEGAEWLGRWLRWRREVEAAGSGQGRSVAERKLAAQFT